MTSQVPAGTPLMRKMPSEFVRAPRFAPGTVTVANGIAWPVRRSVTHGFRSRNQLEHDLGRDSEGAFTSHKKAREIISRIVLGFAAGPDDRAVIKHEFSAQHMIGGYAVLETVGPP